MNNNSDGDNNNNNNNNNDNNPTYQMLKWHTILKTKTFGLWNSKIAGKTLAKTCFGWLCI